MKTIVSAVSNKEFPAEEMISGKSVRSSILTFIQKEIPNFTVDDYLSSGELNSYREKYISYYLTKEVGELSELEKAVLTSMKEHSTLSDKIDGDFQKLTFGQRVADKVATFGGSWKFIISFGVFIFLWIGINIYWFQNKGFDPYPFILLNLILSCLASLQAPVIMMSQNRQEEKDRERSKKDYMVNLKSELEIRLLHEKVDHLILHQQHELLEFQKLQVEMMNDILNQINKNGH